MVYLFQVSYILENITESYQVLIPLFLPHSYLPKQGIILH